MSEWSHIRGVISCRSNGLTLMERLHTQLERIGIGEVALWGDLRLEGPGDPRTKFRKFAATCDFAIILLDHTGFDHPRPDEQCVQQAEVDAILEREDAARSGGGRFHRFVVLLRDADGFPDRKQIREKLPPAYSMLVRDENFEDFREGESATDFARKIAMRLKGHLEQEADARGRRLPSSNGPPGARQSLRALGPEATAAESATPQPKSPLFNIADIELQYMRKRIRAWAFGQVDSEPEERKVTMARDGRDLFAFRPQRFVEFKASERRFRYGGDESVPGEEGLPISHWLFAQQDHPIILIGDGGAGKTTAVTAAACGFASVWSETLRNECAQIAGKWIDQATAKLESEPRFVPIVMRCEEACAAFSEGAEPSDNVLRAVAQHLRRRSMSDHVDDAAFCAALLQRMREQPYALIFDGLDEVANRALARKLFIAARSLADDVNDRGSNSLRIIFTSRPTHSIDSQRIEVVLARPIDDTTTVDSFIERFTADVEARSQLKTRVRALAGNADGAKAPLSSPLLLNAFCCIARSETIDAPYVFRFCSEVIEYFLRGREFAVLRKAMKQSNAERAVVSNTARRILRHLGYLMVRDGHMNCRRSAAIQMVYDGRSDFGLLDIDAAGTGTVTAESVIDDIVQEFALLQSVEHRLAFTNTGMFGEYLAGEFMAFEAGGEGLRIAASDKKRLKMQAWRSALRFARAALRARAGFHDENIALEAPDALLRLAEGADEPATALLATRTAIEMIAENPAGPTLDGNEDHLLVELGVRARAIYSARSAQWTAEERSDLVDAWFRCGLRSNATDTLQSVDRLAALWLHPRRRWIPLSSPGLPPGFRIAATPVLVCEFNAFVVDPDADIDEFWPLASEPEDHDWTGSLGSPSDGESRALRRRRDYWNLQLERPGAALTHVTWFEADAYCRWQTRRLQSIGKLPLSDTLRLPTLAEWNVLMAEVYGDREYPCDVQELEESPMRLNWEGAGCIGPTAPGVFDWMGKEGLYDLGSNVRTWLYPDEADLEGWKDPNMRKVECIGGSWSRGRKALMTRTLPDGASPTDSYIDVGLRLVRVSGTPS